MLLLLAVQGADARGILGTGIGPDLGPSLSPFPSVSELLSGVVKGLFSALLNALTPNFLKHADIHTLEWLVALPNVADSSTWPTVGRLQGDMVWVAGAMLPTFLIIATTRDTVLSLTFRAHPGNALLRVIGAVFWLVLYRFSVENALAFVNVLTHTMLSWPVVAEGLHRTVLVLFGGSVIAGVGGAFLGLLGLVALFFAITLFALKVMLLMVLAVLYVAGPFLIGLAPLPVVGYLNRAWLLAVVGLCLIPLGWCVIFATAGAISLDVTNLGSGAHLGSRTVGAFAAIATFYVAFRWPLMVLGHVRASVGGIGVRLGGGSGGGRGAMQSDGVLAAKAQRARVGLQAAMLSGGRSVGLAAGALGAPAGGLVGAAGRRARPHVASTAAVGAIALGPPRPPSPTGDAGEDRIARAAQVLRGAPGRMREAWRGAASAPTPPRSNGASNASGQAPSSRRKSRAASQSPRSQPDAPRGRSRRRPPKSSGGSAPSPRPSTSSGPPASSPTGRDAGGRRARPPVEPASVKPAPAQRSPAPGRESPAQRQAAAPARADDAARARGRVPNPPDRSPGARSPDGGKRRSSPPPPRPVRARPPRKGKRS